MAGSKTPTTARFSGWSASTGANLEARLTSVILRQTERQTGHGAARQLRSELDFRYPRDRLRRTSDPEEVTLLVCQVLPHRELFRFEQESSEGRGEDLYACYAG